MLPRLMSPRTPILPPIVRAALAIACGALARLAPGAESSPWIVRSYDTEHGLPAARVLSIGQSADGYVWVGTIAGVARFDGMRFTPIPSGPEKMPDDANVTALESGADGRLFFAMQDGRSGEVAGHEWRVRAAAGTGAQVTCMLPNPGGEVVWLGLSSGGLLRLGPAGTQVFKENEGVPPGAVTDLIRDGQGTPWALVANHLLRWNDERWTAAAADSPAALSVDTIAPSRQGGIWLATASAKRGGAQDRPGIWRLHGEDIQWHSGLPVEDPGYYADRKSVV